MMLIEMDLVQNVLEKYVLEKVKHIKDLNGRM